MNRAVEKLVNAWLKSLEAPGKSIFSIGQGLQIFFGGVMHKEGMANWQLKGALLSRCFVRFGGVVHAAESREEIDNQPFTFGDYCSWRNGYVYEFKLWSNCIVHPIVTTRILTRGDSQNKNGLDGHKSSKPLQIAQAIRSFRLND